MNISGFFKHFCCFFKIFFGENLLLFSVYNNYYGVSSRIYLFIFIHEGQTILINYIIAVQKQQTSTLVSHFQGLN